MKVGGEVGGEEVADHGHERRKECVADVVHASAVVEVVGVVVSDCFAEGFPEEGEEEPERSVAVELPDCPVFPRPRMASVWVGSYVEFVLGVWCHLRRRLEC